MPHYYDDEEEIVFADGDNDDDDDSMFDADGGEQSGMVVYNANGRGSKPNQRNVKPMPPRNNPKVVPDDGKYVLITITNASTSARSFYLFSPLAEKGVIAPVGTAFAAIEDSGTDKSLTVTYSDENPELFLQKHRGEQASRIAFMRVAAGNKDYTISTNSAIIERLVEGTGDFQIFKRIHFLGYSSEKNFRVNELSLNLAQRSQDFLISKIYRHKFVAPPSTTISLMLQISESLNIGKAYENGTLR
jgi:hypothetical protein